MYEERMSQYLHQPLQILWFDTSEVAMLVLLYIFALVVGGLAWIGLLIIPFFLIPYKRTLQRGFFQHVLYAYGWRDIKGYPAPTAYQFFE
jgi:hypothetical protein